MIEEKIPEHMDYDGIWRLKDEPSPSLLYDYLTWIASDDSRLENAAESMQWLPVGFYSLVVARQRAPETRKVDKILQLNFYREDIAGNEHPHSHARQARTTWYGGRNTYQHITRWHLLPPEAKSHMDLPVIQRNVVANSIVDLGDGKRPIYSPKIIGKRMLTEFSQTAVAPFGSQEFGSLEIHHVGMVGDGVAVSAHYKDQEEPGWLSEYDGLVHYKGLTPEQALKVEDQRRELQAITRASGSASLGPTTLIFPPLDFTEGDFETSPTKPSLDLAVELILGGLVTSRQLSGR